MMSKYFNRSEFECSCGCGFDTVDTALLDILDKVRYHFCKPVRITSGCRCAEYNASINGAPRSQHVLGRAADIVVEDTSPEEVADYLESINAPAIGRYSGWVHVDSRTNGGARWVS